MPCRCMGATASSRSTPWSATSATPRSRRSTRARRRSRSSSSRGGCSRRGARRDRGRARRDQRAAATRTERKGLEAMSDETARNRRKAEWEVDTYRPFVEEAPERPVRFESLSGIPVEPLYTPEHLDGWRYADKLV